MRDNDVLSAELTHLLHDLPYSGQIGVTRTLKSLQRHCWLTRHES